jgi:hypothetical protein
MRLSWLSLHAGLFIFGVWSSGVQFDVNVFVLPVSSSLGYLYLEFGDLLVFLFRSIGE